MTLYTGIKYQVYPHIALGITDRYSVVKDLNYNSLSFTASFDVNKKLSISTGYSMIAYSYFNIPLAFLWKRNFGQIFLGTDNLTAMVLPSLADYAGISFGACFYLLNKQNRHLKGPDYTNRNLFGKPSEETPFYKPRKIIKNSKNGSIIKSDPRK